MRIRIEYNTLTGMRSSYPLQYEYFNESAIVRHKPYKHEKYKQYKVAFKVVDSDEWYYSKLSMRKFNELLKGEKE